MNFDNLAQQAAQEGAARTADYTNKANQYAGDYSNYQNQANAANANIQAQNDYMKGAGSANNLYTNAFNTQAGLTGYNQNALQQAQAGLTNAVGTQAAYNDFANQAASKWGLNAGGLAAANAGATQNLNNNIASQGGALAAQQKAFEQAQTGANQQTGLNLQQQASQLEGYKNAFNAAYQQQQTAQSAMLAYQKMAQDQGGLTAQQVQGYQQAKAASAQAQASLAAAQQAIAQAKYATAQTAGQNLANQKTQNYLNSVGYQNYLKGTADENGNPIAPQTTQQAPTPVSSGGPSLADYGKGVADWIGQGGFVGDIGRGIQQFAGGLFR